MADVREITSGLQFPEGPIAMDDGSVIVVEIKRGTLTRVQPDGSQEVVAETGGGPNGAAVGPDGAIYVCNNGGFDWIEVNGLTVPHGIPADYNGGCIQRVDINTGKVEVLYTECNGYKLKGPNDIVFDASGGFWFTDFGKVRDHDRDRGGVYYAKPDGSMITEVAQPVDGPNGISLAPGDKKVYIAQTFESRVWQWDITAPGEVVRTEGAGGPILDGPGGATLLNNLPGYQLLDSMAVDSAGYVCVATLMGGAGISAFAPDGSGVDHVPLSDPFTTNVCFGGPDLTTAYVTLSGTGKLVAFDWPRPGLKLNFTA